MVVERGDRRDSDGIRVLWVDDDVEFLDLLSAKFERDSGDVTATVTSSPTDALETLGRESFDCVLSDYKMPEMDGTEFLEAVRDFRPVIPFILVTGKGSESVASDALAAGATDYIPKSNAISEFELVLNRVKNAVQRYRAQANYQQIFNGVNDAVLGLDPGSGDVVEGNEAAMEMWGHQPETLLECSMEDLVVEDLPFDGDGGFPDVGEYEWQCITRDGHRFWSEASLKRAEIRGQERILLVAREITTRIQRERSLDSLLDSVERLLQVESRRGVADFAADMAIQVLNTERVAIFLRDAESSTLEAVTVRQPAESGSWIEDVDEERVLEILADRSVQPLGMSSGSAGDSEMGPNLVCFPLDGRGALLCAADDSDPHSGFTRDLGSLLVAYVTVMLERVEREELLRNRERNLSRQRDELADLNHVNEITRNINQGLVRVSTREEIERVVCERLASADRYDFAWLGRYDPRDQEIDPGSWAGIGQEQLQNHPVSLERSDPASSALSSIIEGSGVQIVRETANESARRIRDRASNRRESVSAYVPVRYQGFSYGVLVISTNSPDAFAPPELAVLEELGETVGHALSAVEWRRSRMEETITEIELDVRDSNAFIINLSSKTGCAVELTDTHIMKGGGLRLFASLSGVSAEELVGIAADHTDVIDIEVHDEQDGELKCEFKVRAPPIVEYLEESGIGIDRVSTTDGSARVLLQAPVSTDVRDIVDTFESVFDDVNLVTRRDRPSSRRNVEDFYTMFREKLTDRQLEVLRVAHHAGYFTWPRRATGEQVASSLGITQPTFHEHVRNIERKLIDGVFDEVPSHLQ